MRMCCPMAIVDCKGFAFQEPVNIGLDLATVKYRIDAQKPRGGQ